MIQGCISCEKRERSDDSARITKADGPCSADTPIHMTLKIHNDPTYDKWAASESAHGNKVDTGVFGMEGMLNRDKDRKADQGKREAEHDEWVPEMGAIGKVG